MIGVRGYLSGCILALTACIGLAVPVLAQENLAQDNCLDGLIVVLV